MPNFFWMEVPPPSGIFAPEQMAWPPMSGSASTMMTDDPASRAIMAAGIPVAPAPITTTSTSLSQRAGTAGAGAAAAGAVATAVVAAVTPAAAPVLIRSRREILFLLAMLPSPENAFARTIAVQTALCIEIPGRRPGWGRSELRVFLFRQRPERLAVEGDVVLFADHFVDVLHPVRPIHELADPRHRERTGVFHPDDHFQSLATLIHDLAIAFDHVQLVRVWRAERIDEQHPVRLFPDRVHDQSIAFEMTDRFSEPGRFWLGGMLLVEIDAPDLMVALIQNGDAVLGLQELHGLAHVQNRRRDHRPARIVGLIDMMQIDFRLRVLAHNLFRPRLQHRVFPVAGHDLFGIFAVDLKPEHGLAFLRALDGVTHRLTRTDPKAGQ